MNEDNLFGGNRYFLLQQCGYVHFFFSLPKFRTLPVRQQSTETYNVGFGSYSGFSREKFGKCCRVGAGRAGPQCPISSVSQTSHHVWHKLKGFGGCGGFAPTQAQFQKGCLYNYTWDTMDKIISKSNRLNIGEKRFHSCECRYVAEAEPCKF